MNITARECEFLKVGDLQKCHLCIGTNQRRRIKTEEKVVAAVWFGIDSIPWSTTVDIFYQDDLEEKDE